jgi:hypothetical protein
MTTEAAEARPTSSRVPLARRGNGLRREGLFPLRRGTLSADVIAGLPSAHIKRLARDVDQALWSLNWMHGEGSRPEAAPFIGGTSGKIERLSSMAQRRCEIHALAALRSDSALSPQKALEGLLKGRSPYSVEAPTSTAAFVNASVSLPSSVREGPLLTSLLPEAAKEKLERFETHMLRDSVEVTRLQSINGAGNVYFDPVLKNNPHKYANFVRRCAKIGLLEYTTECICQLGIFFVVKKNRKLRLILDCRASNILFRDPPPH